MALLTAERIYLGERYPTYRNCGEEIDVSSLDLHYRPEIPGDRVITARYSYGIYLLHYFAMWLGFVVCRSLNAGLQIAIFVATLATLSVILYHSVEAPFTAAGVKVSERLGPLLLLRQVSEPAAKQAARNCS